MTDFPILLYNSTSETPTLSFTWSLIQTEPPRIGHYGETPRATVMNRKTFVLPRLWNNLQLSAQSRWLCNSWYDNKLAEFFLLANRKLYQVIKVNRHLVVGK